IRGEHDSVRGEHNVKGGARERQLLSIGDPEVDVESFCMGALLRPFDQGRHVVYADNFGKTACGGQGSVPIAAPDIEHRLSGLEIHCFAKGLTHDLESRAYHREVSGRPSRLLLGLKGFEVYRFGTRG